MTLVEDEGGGIRFEGAPLGVEKKNAERWKLSNCVETWVRPHLK